MRLVGLRRNAPKLIFKGWGVGYIIAGIKEITGAPVGDTIVHLGAESVGQLPGLQRSNPGLRWPISCEFRRL